MSRPQRDRKPSAEVLAAEENARLLQELKDRAAAQAAERKRQASIIPKKIVLTREQKIDAKTKILQTIFQLETKKDADVMDCTDKKLTIMAKYIFGEAVVDAYLKGVKDDSGKVIIVARPKGIRKIWELGGVEAQCTAVIGGPSGTDCWICGFPVVNSPQKKKVKKGGVKRSLEDSDSESDPNATGLEPTCEHVLPVAQARFFLDLYNPANKGLEISKVLRLEYEYAHRYCNEVKHDDVYILNINTEDDPVWGVNETAIRSTLNKIFIGLSDEDYYPNYKKGKPEILKNIDNKHQEWTYDRLDIMSKRVQLIVDHINRTRVDGITPGIGRLVNLAGTMRCLDSRNIKDDMVSIMKAMESSIVVDVPEVTKQPPYQEELLAKFDEDERDAILGLVALKDIAVPEDLKDPPESAWDALFRAISFVSKKPPGKK
jgi:hypothetical protein